MRTNAEIGELIAWFDAGVEDGFDAYFDVEDGFDAYFDAENFGFVQFDPPEDADFADQYRIGIEVGMANAKAWQRGWDAACAGIVYIPYKDDDEECGLRSYYLMGYESAIEADCGIVGGWA